MGIDGLRHTLVAYHPAASEPESGHVGVQAIIVDIMADLFIAGGAAECTPLMLVRFVLDGVRDFWEKNGGGTYSIVFDRAGLMPEEKKKEQAERRAKWVAECQAKGEEPFYPDDAVLVDEGIVLPGKPPAPFSPKKFFITTKLRPVFYSYFLDQVKKMKAPKGSLILDAWETSPPVEFNMETGERRLREDLATDYGEGDLAAAYHLRKMIESGMRRVAVRTADQDSLMLCGLQHLAEAQRGRDADLQIYWIYKNTERINVSLLMRHVPFDSRFFFILFCSLVGSDYTKRDLVRYINSEKVLAWGSLAARYVDHRALDHATAAERVIASIQAAFLAGVSADIEAAAKTIDHGFVAVAPSEVGKLWAACTRQPKTKPVLLQHLEDREGWLKRLEWLYKYWNLHPDVPDDPLPRSRKRKRD